MHYIVIVIALRKGNTFWSARKQAKPQKKLLFMFLLICRIGGIQAKVPSLLVHICQEVPDMGLLPLVVPN